MGAALWGMEKFALWAVRDIPHVSPALEFLQSGFSAATEFRPESRHFRRCWLFRRRRARRACLWSSSGFSRCRVKLKVFLDFDWNQRREWNFSSKSGSGEPPARNKSRAERIDAVAKNLQNPVRFFQRQKMIFEEMIFEENFCACRSCFRSFWKVEDLHFFICWKSPRFSIQLTIFCQIFLACH